MSNSEQQLKLKRGGLKGQLTRFVKFVSEITENTEVTEILTRLEKIEPILDNFNEIQTEIELFGDKIQESERTSFEDLYFQFVSKAKQEIASRNALNKQDNASEPSSNESQISRVVNNDILDIHSKVKLPPIKLPEFFGSYEQWLTFADIFTSLVHENSQLNNAQKFVYLRSCVKGEAAQLIHSLEMTNANYPIAWGILKDRYENKKLILHCHIKNIFEMQTIKAECYTQLRALLDNFNKNLRTLTALEQPTEQWDTLLVYILTSKFDNNTKKEWEETTADIDFPTVNHLTEFLSKRCNLLETIDNRNKPTKVGGREKVLTHITTKVSCAFCKGSHLNFSCDKIKNMAQNELHAEIKKHRLCLNCLRPFHTHDKCKSTGCKHCGRKHNSLLHISKNIGEPDIPSRENIPGTSDRRQSIENGVVFAEQSVNLHCTTSETSQVLLATVQLDVLDCDGRAVKARAVLDSGSQTSFITRNLVDKLKLTVSKIDIPVASINSTMNKINGRVEATILSLQRNYKKNESFLIIDQITERLPQISFDLANLDIPQNILLADTSCHKTQPVDMLLGASIFFEILCVGQIKTGRGKPILQKTRFGWILSGTLISDYSVHNSLCNFTTLADENLNEQIEKFWKLEETTSKATYSNEEQACERHFLENFKRNAQGRFQVALPLKKNFSELGESKIRAVERFRKLEKRFERDDNFKAEYCKFMTEYEQLGHMTRIDCDTLNNDGLNYYLPHHGVIKESSSTTKLRVVFDASAKSTSGLSLNNVLMVGPVIQRDLFSIVLKFRRHNVAFTGDIEKMYRQIGIAESDRDLLRIVWRDSPERELSHFRLNTVTYGTASASYLATRVLHQVAFDNATQYPEASTVLRDFYMDDLLCGHDSIENAKRLKNELCEILKAAGLVLRKFYSNHVIVTSDDISDSKEESNYNITDDNNCKTLGLVWNPTLDIFCYSVHLARPEVVTKRQILSTIAKIFDLLGLISPVTVIAKLILQKLWQFKSDWDESVSIELFTMWNKFFENLPAINKIKIPRQVTTVNFVSFEMHGFGDSSESAYGCCIYIVTVDAYDNRFSKLLCAKSRVAPLKTVSLPRLELCGALLVAQLAKKCEQALDMTIINKTYWCDSTIALNWIAGEPNFWKTFVANRVSEIHELTDKTQWRHINSEQNPADMVSRGVTPQNLEHSDLWWRGPDFLTKNKEFWPKNIDFNFSDDTLERRRPIPLSFVNIIGQDQSIFNRFSSFKKLIRVVTFMLKFIDHLKYRTGRIKQSISNYLDPSDLNKSIKILVKIVQGTAFSYEIKDLQRGKPVSKKSKLFSLHPFLDEANLIRVGGRIRNSNFPSDKKFPIVLPPDHNFTKLLIEQEHRSLFHAGLQATLFSLRSKYWIINGKSAVKRQLYKCIICFKIKPYSNNPLMGDLPEARVVQARPFLKVGCDFAGPIMIKDGRLRTRKFVKSYICMFVCFVTRAVHIELAGDLTSECFLNCLKRFVSRRGLCHQIFTDNGKNFVGAQRELIKIYKSLKNDIVLRDFLLENQIEWKFIPPRSPHFGGLWEAAIKSAKYHLGRVLRDANIDYERLYTVLSQIEAILNSRPLTPLSSDSKDLLPLTPSHFLIGDLLTAIPEIDVPEQPSSRLRVYQRMQQLANHFWRRWSSDYITLLQTRTKWRRDNPSSMKVRSLVLIKEDSLRPQHWKLGRIVQLHPGRDNIVRVASVYTGSGIIKRSVVKLCCLPMDI